MTQHRRDKKAVEWYQKAAELGQTNAEEALGWRYLNGKGVPKDSSKAFEYYQKAAANTFADTAQHSLGFMYFRGEGVPMDLAKAVEWWQKAAEMGNANAQFTLGMTYQHGVGIPKDAVKAGEWYQRAAAQNNASAQFALGLMYEEGDGVPKDATKAVEWYQKAAAQGDAKAQFNVGLMYGKGDGVPRDNVLGYAWGNLAASQGTEYVSVRDALARRISAAELAEAQRLSSAWKKGQILAREGRPTSLSAAPSSIPGNLSKKGTGSLFVVSGTGQAVTNHHVVAECAELRVEGRDGLAKVVTVDAMNDLALVQIPGDAKASAAINAAPGKLRQGEDIVVFGFPLNAVLSSGGNLTPGVVSALTGLGNNTNQIQITAPIQPGSSGSPVMTKKGDVVGVVSMKLSDAKMAKATGSVGQNVNFAVNGQTLKTFLDTHKVVYRSGGGFFSWDKSTADLADEARKWTLMVECWR